MWPADETLASLSPMKRPFSPDTPPTRYDREDFRRQVYQVVRAIPRGRVLSYGGIARLIGHPSHARAVGTALKNAPEGIPCHRVVDSRGRIVPGWAHQRELLEGEGVRFSDEVRVDMRRCAWDFDRE